MAHITSSNRGSFGSKFGIIAAAAGSAIGLGNIWRFPYVTGENGGGAFLIVYLVFILAIGLPVMLSEFVIGRATNRNPYGAFKMLKPNQPWYLIGIMGILGAFFILAFYGAVGGWTIEYLIQSVQNGFEGKDPTAIGEMFSNFQHNGKRPVLLQLIFMGLTMFVVVAGIEKGIEKYTKILMPVLLLLIIVICIRAITLPGAGEGLAFLFNPDFSKLASERMPLGINYPVILEALGQAFFSLSIGMGTLITYGSYIQKNDNLGSSAFIVSMADTLIAILAGVAIFPAVFAFGIKPDAGPALVFETLPNIFQQMPGGYYFGLLFFLLLMIAALTSSISVLEVVVAFTVEQFNMSRKKATILAGALIAVIGIFCALFRT
jgi:NSS family neurotransmitter:Na+ symporter